MLYDAARKVDEENSIYHAIRVAESRGQELCDAILDPWTLKIVAMTIGRSLSVKEIGSNLGISSVSCYKNVERLVEYGLLAPTPKLRTSTHGRAIGYTATVKSGSITLKDGQLEILCNSKEGKICFAEDALSPSLDSYLPTPGSTRCALRVPVRRGMACEGMIYR